MPASALDRSVLLCMEWVFLEGGPLEARLSAWLVLTVACWLVATLLAPGPPAS